MTAPMPNGAASVSMRLLATGLLAFAALVPLRAQEKPATAVPPAAAPRASLKVGVTLHPYYSWTRAIVAGSDVEVRSLLPGDVDAGNYQPRAEEIAKLAELDAVVVNGLGHDDFLEPMIVASGNVKLVRLTPNDATPTLRGAHGEAANSHTFISFTNAIQQTYWLERALGELAPQHAPLFRKNAADYARKLRRLKAAAALELADVEAARVATVHDGYAYLLQEFGIEVAVVIEPAHGLVPSAAELAASIDRLRSEQVRVLFSEESFPQPLLDVVRESAQAELFVLSHVATGDYTDDKFEREMAENAATIVRALKPAAKRQ